MTATNHALTGTAIAIVTTGTWGWPWPVALVLALVSHFVIDEIPHWDHKFKNNSHTQVSVIADLALACILILGLAFTLDISALLVLSASALAVLPDAMWITEFNGPKLAREKDRSAWNRFRWFFHKIQWSESPKGFFVEVAWFVLMIVVIFGANHGLINGQ